MLLRKIVSSGIIVLFSNTFSFADVPGKDTPKNIEGFRLSYEEMYDIANPRKLSHRIFYTAPSQGAHAAWFDAVKKGDLETVKHMANAGQDIEVKDEAALGQTALGWAAFIGYQDMVEYLVGKKANLFATDRADVLHVFKSAVLGKNITTVQYLYPLLKDRIIIDEQEPDGETLIMVAASNDRIDIVTYLLELGADVNIVSEPRNATALSYACERGYTNMVSLLIEAKAVNHKTKKSSCE